MRQPRQVANLGVDMLTLVGHKFGAPKGVAALFVRRGLSLPPMIHGGGQEAGRRAGTENVLLISGMGKAAEVRLLLVRRRCLCRYRCRSRRYCCVLRVKTKTLRCSFSHPMFRTRSNGIETSVCLCRGLTKIRYK